MSTARISRPALLALAIAGLAFAVSWLGLGGEPTAAPVDTAAAVAPGDPADAGGVPASSRALDRPADVRGYDYALTWTTEQRLRVGDALEVQALRRELTGRMVWRVVERRTHDLLCAVAFPATDVRTWVQGESADDPELPAALECVTLVRRTPAGQTVGYRFDPRLTSEDRDVVRTLVSACRAVLPDDAGQVSWTADEVDPSGPYSAHYVVTRPASDGRGRELRKVKLAPEEGTRGNTPPLELRDCEAGLTLESGTGREAWIEKATYDERLVAALAELEAEIEVVVHAEFTRRDEPGDGAAVPVPAVIADGPWASLDGADELDGADGDWADEDWDEEVASITLAEALGQLDGLLASGRLDPVARHELLERVAASVARDPAFLQEIAAWLNGPVPGEVAGFLLAAVGAADTDAAASFLVERFSDPTADRARRRAALVSSTQLSRAATAGVRRSLRELAGNPAEPPSLRRTALLALGAASRAGEGRDAGDRDLLDYENTAAERGELAVWFSALANADTAAALERLAPYLRHADVELRRAATAAAGRMTVAGALELVAERARQETDPAPRAAAALALALRPSESTWSTIEQLSRDAVSAVRRATLAGLARGETSAAARALLARMAAGDPAPALRGAARKALEAGR